MLAHAHCRVCMCHMIKVTCTMLGHHAFSSSVQVLAVCLADLIIHLAGYDLKAMSCPDL